jgi:hypothetical protein
MSAPQTIGRMATGVVAAAGCLMLAGCFSASVIERVQGTAVLQAPWIRVRECWWHPDGRLLILAEGGPWQADPERIGRDRFHFAINVVALRGIPEAAKSAVQLPPKVMHPGWPAPELLAKSGFRRTAFRERHLQMVLRNVSSDSNLALSRVNVIYTYFATTREFPEGLGMEPYIELTGSATPRVAFVITSWGSKDRDLVGLVRLPLTVPLDVVTFPVQVMLSEAYSGVQ